jgi:hypothetical protein
MTGFPNVLPRMTERRKHVNAAAIGPAAGGVNVIRLFY